MTVDDEDAALMLRVGQGDRSAFATLFDRHQASVVRFAYRFVGSQAKAEEVAQEVFWKVFRSAKSYRPTARFKTWLFRIATNHCLNETRRGEHRMETRDDTATESDARGGSAETPDDVLAGKEVEAAVARALTGMSERERAAFCMCRFEGLAYRDIASALEASEAAVKSLIHRATLQVSEQLSVLKAGLQQRSDA